MSTENTPELQQLIADAEQRGYLRGRTEAAQSLINQPAMFEDQVPDSEPVRTSPLLSPRRVSIWDLP
ncbi:MAG: hypothetical protein NC343_03525 [Muribaculum sp.]|nr:hypothetical protein [Muribaculaceae bacterium]MCM1080798.1 hypothetical protein [Muribaculum sp.]